MSADRGQPGFDQIKDDARDWVSFEDPDFQRTWIFDATFLTSNWSCIYGAGCLGILPYPAPEKALGCCHLGAYLTDAKDARRVEKAAARLTADQWQHMPLPGRSALRTRPGGERSTRVVGGGCIFLNRPGFAGGAGCALHIGAVAAGEEPHTWKPNTCWQLPLRLEDTVDDNGWMTSIVREWRSRDFGPGGEEFNWWCTESPLAFVGATPVYLSLRAELVQMVGQRVYDMLATKLRRPQLLPHPMMRNGQTNPPARAPRPSTNA